MKKSLNDSINKTKKNPYQFTHRVIQYYFSWSSKKKSNDIKYTFSFSLEILPRNDITFANERQRKRAEFFIVIWSIKDESMKLDINGIFRIFGRVLKQRWVRENEKWESFFIFIKYILEATSNKRHWKKKLPKKY